MASYSTLQAFPQEDGYICSCHEFKFNSPLRSCTIGVQGIVCTYPLDIHNIILKYTVSSTCKASLHSLCPLSGCILWDSVCMNTLNNAYKCIIHYVSILCHDASELNSSGESL